MLFVLITYDHKQDHGSCIGVVSYVVLEHLRPLRLHNSNVCMLTLEPHKIYISQLCLVSYSLRLKNGNERHSRSESTKLVFVFGRGSIRDLTWELTILPLPAVGRGGRGYPSLFSIQSTPSASHSRRLGSCPPRTKVTLLDLCVAYHFSAASAA